VSELVIDVPQYGIVVQQKGAEVTERGRPKLMMLFQISTSSTNHQFYLCDVSDNFQDIAKKVHDMICEAGNEGRRAQSGLVAVKGGSDGFRAEKQGRQQRGPRPAGA
jgi:hypothetical protein